MNSVLVKTLIFTAGAAVGSAVTWKFVETKYKKLAQEEIDSVKKAFAKRQPVSKTAEVVSYDEKTREQYANVLNSEKYTNYSNAYKKEEEKKEMTDDPYVITPEEFDEHPDYEKRSLTYYNDKILTDEQDEIIEDIDAVVGLDSLTHFGEYEADSVFVRDDILKTDYEILLDLRNYADVNGTPQYTEDY